MTRVQIFDEAFCISLRDMKTLSYAGHPWEKYESNGGARGVMVIVVGNGLGDTSSNPGCD